MTGDHGARIAKTNRVVLHELYFDNMSAGSSDPTSLVREVLSKRCGPLAKWKADYVKAFTEHIDWAEIDRQVRAIRD